MSLFIILLILIQLALLAIIVVLNRIDTEDELDEVLIRPLGLITLAVSIFTLSLIAFQCSSPRVYPEPDPSNFEVLDDYVDLDSLREVNSIKHFK